MPIRKGKGVAVMVTFRAAELATIDEWAESIERLPRAVAIRRAAIEAAERALRARRLGDASDLADLTGVRGG